MKGCDFMGQVEDFEICFSLKNISWISTINATRGMETQNGFPEITSELFVSGMPRLIRQYGNA